jgi:hypothetical protein
LQFFSLALQISSEDVKHEFSEKASSIKIMQCKKYNIINFFWGITFHFPNQIKIIPITIYIEINFLTNFQSRTYQPNDIINEMSQMRGKKFSTKKKN